MDLVVINLGVSLKDLAARLGEGRVTPIMARTLNRESRPLRTAVVNSLTHQTGLPRRTILAAVREDKANAGKMEYRLTTQGGYIRLKYFRPKEGGGGVTAYPRGEAHFYAGYFLTSGPTGRRAMSPKLNGQVYVQRKLAGGGNRPGPWWSKIKVGRSDVMIPKEMVEGETLKAWQVRSVSIGSRVASEVLRQLLAGA